MPHQKECTSWVPLSKGQIKIPWDYSNVGLFLHWKWEKSFLGQITKFSTETYNPSDKDLLLRSYTLQ